MYCAETYNAPVALPLRLRTDCGQTTCLQQRECSLVTVSAKFNAKRKPTWSGRARWTTYPIESIYTIFTQTGNNTEMKLKRNIWGWRLIWCGSGMGPVAGLVHPEVPKRWRMSCLKFTRRTILHELFILVNTTEDSFHTSTLKHLCKEWIYVFTPFHLITFRTVQNHRKCALGILHGFICLLLFETPFAPISIQWIMTEAHAEIYNGLHLKFCYCHLILTKLGQVNKFY
jgi:hypothetical protein